MSFLESMGVVVKKTEEQDFLSSLGVKPVSAVQPIQTESTDFLSEMGVKKGTKLERLAKSFGSGAFGTVTSAASALEAAGTDEFEMSSPDLSAALVGLLRVGTKKVGTLISEAETTKTIKKFLTVEDQSFDEKVASGFGSAATFIIPGTAAMKGAQALKMAPKMAALLGTSISSVMESAVEAGSSYETAQHLGKTENEAKNAAGQTFVANLPLNFILDKWMFNKIPEGREITQLLKGSSQEAVQEAVQEVIQSVALDQEIDPKSIGESALIGGIVGGGVAGAQVSVKSFKELQDKKAEAFKKVKEGELDAYTDALKEEIVETSQTVDDFIEGFSVPAGLSVKEITAKSRGLNFINLPEGANTQSVNPEVEKRWTAAKGLKTEGFLKRSKELMVDLKDSYRRHFPYLNPKTDGAITETLRQFEAIKNYSQATSVGTIRGITAGLSPAQYEVFSRNIILNDLVKDFETGLYKDKKEFPFGYKNISQIRADISNNKKIIKANPNIQQSLKLRNSFMNTLRNELVENNVLPEEVKNDERYFHRQTLAYMNLTTKGTGTGASKVEKSKKGFQKRRKGGTLDYNTEYIESEFEVVAQSIAQIETVKAIRKIKNQVDISDKLKEQAKEQGIKNWKDILPDGYTLWQPEKGNHFFLVNAISDKTLQNLFSGQLNDLNLDKDETELVHKVLSVGQKKTEFAVPERIAKQLDSMKPAREDFAFEKIARTLNTNWKIWTLLNPLKVTRYNLNNMSGDLDIVLAYDPTILKHFKSAAKDLYSYQIRKKAPTKEILEAIQKGVLDSGLTLEEIPELKNDAILEEIMGNKKMNMTRKFWNKTKELTLWRENILRLSAYRHFKETVKTNKRIYAASRQDEIDAITDLNDKAAKLSRELIGDYGNISKGGQWLREHMLPFYSWIEVNSPRYFRLLKNAPAEGVDVGDVASRIAKVGAKKAVFSTSRRMVQMFMLYSMVHLYNRIRFPEEEEELGSTNRQLHIILGKNEDTGKISTMRFQGAFSDVLSWVGAEDFPSDIKDIFEGKATLGDKGKEALDSAASKIYNSLSPFIKGPGELISGKKFYPSISSPRAIRDNAEYLAQVASLKFPYKMISGKPRKGLIEEASKKIKYSVDPGEAAYWDSKNLVIKYLEKQGKEFPSVSPTKRSNALYFYKKSIVYGDEEAAEKYLEKYKELGGTKKGLKISFKRAHPLGSLSKKDRAGFMKSLSGKEKERLEKSIKWYGKIYLQKKGD